MSNNKPFVFDNEIRSQLAGYLEEHDLTQAHIARKLGFTATRICKYLNLDNPEAKAEVDAERVQDAARSFLRHHSRQVALRQSLYPNEISARVAAILLQVRRTGDIGLIHGDAGIGKTCAAELFCSDNPTSLFITITRWRRDSIAIEGLLFNELDNDTWPGNIRRAVWMEELLRGSDRMIIVDNAHRLHMTGFEWLFDFHDATGCPLGLIGNAEVLSTVHRSDQLSSRIGIVREFNKVDDAEAKPIAQRMIATYAAEGAHDLLTDATSMVNEKGHLRSLKKRLLLTNEIRKEFKDWVTAFKAAGTQLIKPGRVTK
jgi:DNA transposition AAA+ family ATPase